MSFESLARIQAPVISIHRCVSCAGSGTRHPENNGSSVNCRDCARAHGVYMVRDAVWREAWPEYAALKSALNQKYRGTNEHFRTHLSLCLCCLQKRLKRPLRKEDFDLTLPVNDLIVLGIEMGARLTQEPESREVTR